MSIGNIKSTLRNKPTMNAWIPIALLPIPPKRLDKLPTYPQEAQELDALQVTHEILSSILSPLSDAKSQTGIEMVCCDEKVRNCVPKLSAWLADHMENVMIHGITSNRCPICIAPPDEFGELPDAPYATRPHPSYAAAYHNSDVKRLESDGVKNVNNALWHIPHCEPHEIVRPDTLHTLLLGILTHLMKWVQEFLEYVGRMTIFDHVWSRLPPFPGFTRPNKAYRSVTQWQGKEMRNLLRVLLGVFTAALSRTTDADPIAPRHKPLCHKAILCVRYITDYILIAQYQVHTPGTIQSMRDYLEDFHNHKDVFLRFRATKTVQTMARQASKALRGEHQRLLASDDVREQSAAKRQKLQQDLRLETDELVHDFLTTGAHYNFPKMHLISHFADQIEKYGSLPQYSTEICEASHKPLKDAYRRSNHINAMPQIIRTYTRAHSFAMRERNIQQWLTELDHIPEDIRDIIPPTRPGLHLPRDVSPDLTRSKLQGRICNKTIHNTHTLQTIFELPDLQTLTSIYLRCNQIHGLSHQVDSDVARLLEAPVEAFNTLQVAVPTFNDDGYNLHCMRCTGPHLFRKQDKRSDWVFIRRRKAARGTKVTGGLDGKIPAKLNALFKLRDINANRSYRLAHISLLTVVGSPTPDGPEGMVRVGTPLKNHVVRIGDIEGMAHLITINPDNLYLVNNRIDVHTWNEIHDGN